jgi:hypothetical protein
MGVLEGVQQEPMGGEQRESCGVAGRGALRGGDRGLGREAASERNCGYGRVCAGGEMGEGFVRTGVGEGID